MRVICKEEIGRTINYAIVIEKDVSETEDEARIEKIEATYTVMYDNNSDSQTDELVFCEKEDENKFTDKEIEQIKELANTL